VHARAMLTCSVATVRGYIDASAAVPFCSFCVYVLLTVPRCGTFFSSDMLVVTCPSKSPFLPPAMYCSNVQGL
jgi:hypothetical protein